MCGSWQKKFMHHRYIVTIGIFHAVSEITCHFSRKLHICPQPHVFNAPAKGFPLEVFNGGGAQKKLE